MTAPLRAPAVAVLAFALWAAPAAAHARSRRTFEHTRFSVALPGGWYVAERRPGPRGDHFVPARQPRKAVTARVVDLADGRGNWFSIHVDQALDLEADAIWTVRPAPDGASVEIGREGAPCGGSGSGGACSAGNGTLEIGTLPAVALRGHTFGFAFGNTLREHGVDLETFRWILQNFRAR
jgi:hypothetical protein